MSRGNLAALLDGPARWNSGEPALALGTRCLRTWAELAGAVAARAGGLRNRHQIVPGSRVGLFATNSSEFLEFLYAIWQAGGVAVPISSRLHPREAAALLATAGAGTCVVSPELADGLSAHAGEVELIVVGTQEEQDLLASAPVPPVPRELTDDAWIFFTSGTTGLPKGARLSHGNLLAMAAAYHADVDSIGPGDSLIHVAALSHASGLFSLPFLARGATQVIPASGGFDAEELIGLLHSARRASFFLPPTLVRRLARTPGADQVAERIGTLLVGAAPVRADDLREGVSAFGSRLWNGYGQGESPCTITAMSPAAIAAALVEEESAVESVGVARWATRVRTVGPDGAELPTGEVGEVVVAGPTVMSGYLDLPEDSAQTLRGGWLHTGDLGRFDAAGRLTLVDRMKDMLISGGYNVYPREIEDVLLRDPAVAEAAVIGVPDPEWGERVIAFVVGAARASVDTAALDARCLAEIARYKRPREYHVVAELPRNAAGKVLKRELHHRLPTEAAS